jgi:hypothetical protein
MNQKIFGIFIVILFFSLSSCTAQSTKNSTIEKNNSTEPSKPRNFARELLRWDNDFVEYGKVKKGETRDHTYKFTNISKEDIEINICTACSCTTLEWTTKVIKPGESGEIKTHFDSSEKDKSETINITIILKNTDPVLNYPIIDEVRFHFDLIQ